MINLTGHKPLRGAVINTSHPLSKGIRAAYLFNEGNGSIIFDTSSHQIASRQIQGSGGDDSWSNGGYVFKPSPSNGCWFSVPTKGWGPGTGPFTIVFGASPAATQLSEWATVLSWNAYSPAVYFNTGVLNLYPSILFGSTDWRGQGYHHFAIVRKSTAANQTIGYADAQVIGTGRYTANLAAPTNMRIGWDSYQSDFFSGLLDYVYFFHRNLTQTELTILKNDPYCIFRDNLTNKIFTSLSGSSTTPVPTTSSTSNYQESISDELLVSDILVGKSIKMSCVSTDNTKLSDNIQNNVSAINNSSDNIKLSDSNICIASMDSLSVDNIKVSDSIILNIISQISTSDNFILSDSITLNNIVILSTIDNIKLSDSNTKNLQMLEELSDIIKLSDQNIVSISLYLSTSDSLIISDTSEKTIKYIVEALDNIKLSDVSSTIISMLSTILDEIVVSDSTIHSSGSVEAVHLVLTALKSDIDADVKTITLVFSAKVPKITFAVK